VNHLNVFAHVIVTSLNCRLREASGSACWILGVVIVCFPHPLDGLATVLQIQKRLP